MIIDINSAKIFQKKNLILQDVNLQIQPSEFVYLIGKTGAGKSTLLKTLYGDLPLIEGEATVCGFDLKTINKKAKQHEALLIIDGSQSVGALPFSVKEIQPDALICAGYKWLLGPYAIGMAYFSDRLTNGRPLEENWINRVGSDQFASLTDYTGQYRPGAVRYDVGETSNFILAPMFLDAVNQLLDWGVKNMHNYVAELAKPMLNEFRGNGLVATEIDSFSPHLFSVQLPSHVDVEKLSAAFAANNVFTSVRGTGLRISPNVYNSTKDIDVLKGLVIEAID